jgi:aspartate beta-hydroxylase
MAPREAGATYARPSALSSIARAAAKYARGCAPELPASHSDVPARDRIRTAQTDDGGEFLSSTNAVAPDHATVLRMIQASRAAGAAGRTAEADELLARAAQLAPAHPAVLNEQGLRTMQRGEAVKARELFQRATAADPSHPALWSNLASSLHALRLPQEEMAAIERALALEPRHLPALLQKGALIEDRGDTRNAARIYRNALATVPPDVTPPPTLSAALERAREVVRRDDTALARAIEARLATIRERHGRGPYRRLDRCIELLTGKRQRYAPLPTFLYFPELPALEFFERTEFPWLDAIEAATDEIRAELTTVLASDPSGLEPYVAYPEGVPLDQWKELNKSRRWSAYFLWNQGVAQPAHLSRCPRTAEVLRGAPQCDVADHGPTAFFSILDARTHIPPHTGVTNTRVTVHLPLIVPPDCGFRVGSETREWIPGKAWVFDDTIEHEAWNRSDTPRAVLIFDVWNPYLSEAERDLVRATIEVVGTYSSGAAASVA